MTSNIQNTKPQGFVAFLKLAFASLWVAIPLTIIYISSCAIATFIENDYGTATAKALIYNTWWFDVLHLYLLITLIGSFITSKAWQRKKYASLLFHSSLIFIIVGAGVTRFMGFEGMMHIREGERSNFILSNETYINIQASNAEGQTQSLSILANLISGDSLSETLSVFGKPLKLKVLKVEKLSLDKRDPTSKLELSLDYASFSDKIELIGGIGLEGKPIALENGGTTLVLSWGVKRILLPFSIALKDFQLDRYAGSNSPSSYASEVEIIDDQAKILSKPFRIFMNNVLDYGGYRFFQSSYDTDEQGTILSVNNDPGKNLTYIGYALLILGSIWLLLDKRGRFRRLGEFLNSQKVFSLLLFALLFLGLQTPSYAYAPDNLTPEKKIQMLQSGLEKFRESTKDFSLKFEKVLIQDPRGRIYPLNTFATNMVHKITKQDGFLGMNNTQVILGMMTFPQDWYQVKMIKISNPALKKILGVSPESKMIAFIDVFSDGSYVLQNYVEEANRKKPSMRDEFDKDVIAVDERINLVYSITQGDFFKVFPAPSDPNYWMQPRALVDIIQAINAGMINVPNQADFKEPALILQSFQNGISKGLFENQWEEADKSLAMIKDYQKKYSPNLVIEDSKIDSEIFLNKVNFFKYLILPFILTGILLFTVTLFYVFTNKAMPKKVNLSFLVILGIITLLQTIALALRWYISGHAPWSNAYESMLYIAWASAMSAIVFFRKSNLAISAASFLAGISLFVANLGFMDPQVGNLVPVLKSYWLNIHVSIITASYGFLGLCFVLGIITLFMFVFRSEEKKNIDSIILSLTAINEMAMILGLFMLTVGNFLGGVWANESWGRYWGWDPKETWALISIGVYGIILHLRFLGFKNMPYIFAASSVVGFFSILMTYFGVNYYLSGMHSYAAGDPVPVPIFVYFLTGGVLALIIVSLFKRKLSFPNV